MSDGMDPDSALWIKALLQTAILFVLISTVVHMFIRFISAN